MKWGIKKSRRWGKIRCLWENKKQISEITPKKNDPPACPSPDQIALSRVISDFGESSKISKRKSRGFPPIEANGGNRDRLQQCFVNCHVHRGRVRASFVINVSARE